MTEPNLYADRDYYYNEVTHTYVFTLTGVPRPVVLPQQTVEDLVKAYSNLGQNASINECARSFQLPRKWIEKIIRALGHTHDSLPFTPEEIHRKSESELIGEANMLKHAKVFQQIERQSWDATKLDAAKWRGFDEHVLKRLEGSVPGATVVAPAQQPPVTQQPFVAVVTPTDFHWGKYNSAYHGDVVNRKKSEETLVHHTQACLAQVSRFGIPEKFIVGVGSDFFHVDNPMKTTTRGTPQDTDGNTGEILASGCALMVQFCEMLRQVAGVELILMTGNHDEILGQALILYLQAYYRNCPDVVIKAQPLPRMYSQYGSTLLMFTHGEEVKKTNDMARLAAIECPQEWAATNHKVAFTGHLHSERIEDDRGFLRYQLPSLSGEDRWHLKHGYTGNRKTIAAVLIDKQDGVVASLYSQGLPEAPLPVQVNPEPTKATGVMNGTPVEPACDCGVGVAKVNLLNNQVLHVYRSAKETLADGFDPTHVYKCLRGERNQHGGFGWRRIS